MGKKKSKLGVNNPEMSNLSALLLEFRKIMAVTRCHFIFFFVSMLALLELFEALQMVQTHSEKATYAAFICVRRQSLNTHFTIVKHGTVFLPRRCYWGFSYQLGGTDSLLLQGAISGIFIGNEFCVIPLKAPLCIVPFSSYLLLFLLVLSPHWYLWFWV